MCSSPHIIDLKLQGQQESTRVHSLCSWPCRTVYLRAREVCGQKTPCCFSSLGNSSSWGWVAVYSPESHAPLRKHELFFPPSWPQSVISQTVSCQQLSGRTAFRNRLVLLPEEKLKERRWTVARRWPASIPGGHQAMILASVLRTSAAAAWEGSSSRSEIAADVWGSW